METKRGHVVTFYSYRGGTGRSMALANTACLLAAAGKSVLVIDWDWQSPGQHVIFAPHVKNAFAQIPDSDKAYSEHIGLLELLSQLYRNARPLVMRSEPGKDEIDTTLAFVQESYIDHCIIKTDIANLSLLKCGGMSTFYNGAMSFDWEQKWKDCPYLIFALMERLSHEYDYVLVDSTAGLGDIATICTAVVPDQLVFTVSPHRGNLEGGIPMLRQAAEYRQGSSDLRPLQIFPLLTLTDDREYDMRIALIQQVETTFSALFREIYALKECSLQPYLYESEIPFFPWASYGDDIAVLKSKVNSINSLEGAYRRFFEHLTSGRLPWEKK